MMSERSPHIWVISPNPLIEYVLTEFGIASPLHGRDQPPVKSLECYVGPSPTPPLDVGISQLWLCPRIAAAPFMSNSSSTHSQSYFLYC